MASSIVFLTKQTMNKGKTMKEFYRVSRKVNGVLDILDWTSNKKDIFKIIFDHTRLIPNGTFSTFCKGLDAARAEGKKEVSINVGYSPYFIATSLTPTIEIEIQL